MIICQNCGKNVDQPEKYCPYCGSSLKQSADKGHDSVSIVRGSSNTKYGSKKAAEPKPGTARCIIGLLLIVATIVFAVRHTPFIWIVLGMVAIVFTASAYEKGLIWNNGIAAALKASSIIAFIVCYIYKIVYYAKMVTPEDGSGLWGIGGLLLVLGIIGLVFTGVYTVHKSYLSAVGWGALQSLVRAGAVISIIAGLGFTLMGC